MIHYLQAKLPQVMDVFRVETADFAFVINMGVARQLGMYPPIELLQIAETVE